MNRIFKVVFNRARGRCGVASELARTRSKKGSKAAAAFCAAAALGLAAGAAQAGELWAGDVLNDEVYENWGYWVCDSRFIQGGERGWGLFADGFTEGLVIERMDATSGLRIQGREAGVQVQNTPGMEIDLFTYALTIESEGGTAVKLLPSSKSELSLYAGRIQLFGTKSIDIAGGSGQSLALANATGYYNAASDSLVENHGLLTFGAGGEVEADGKIVTSGGAPGEGEGAQGYAARFVNQASTTAVSGIEVGDNGFLENSGTLAIGAGAAVRLLDRAEAGQDAAFVNTGSVVLKDSASIEIGANAAFENEGSVTTDGSKQGSVTVGSGGRLSAAQGSIAVDAISLLEGAELTIGEERAPAASVSARITNAGGAIDNNGTLNALAGSSL
ncbi:MAG: hypothetical protein HUK26_08095, partial [Duodenibacillus sp.]|nr:hypothetical protein [Duodenibacillus sp.]